MLTITTPDQISATTNNK